MPELAGFLITVLILVLILAVFYWIFMKILAAAGGPPWGPLAVQIFFALVILVILLQWLGSGMPMQGWKGR